MAGHCFEKSLMALCLPSFAGGRSGEFKDWKLCHGIVTGTGGAVEGLRYSHAWLEKGMAVFDADSGKFVERDAYYRAGRIEGVVRYDYETARHKVVAFGHYGPWLDRFYDSRLAG